MLEYSFEALKGVTNKEIFAEIEAAGDTPEQNGKNNSEQKPQDRNVNLLPNV